MRSAWKVRCSAFFVSASRSASRHAARQRRAPASAAPARPAGWSSRGTGPAARRPGARRRARRRCRAAGRAGACRVTDCSKSPSRLAAARVQAQVQRAVGLEAEAARRVVDLHRRHAQVGQHEVEAAAGLGQQRGQCREVHAAHDQHRVVEAQAAQARLGARQLERVDVDAEQAPAGQPGAPGFPARARRSRASRPGRPRPAAGRGWPGSRARRSAGACRPASARAPCTLRNSSA